MKKQNETTKYATPRDIHTPIENGEENMKRLGGTGSGFLYKMLMPEMKFLGNKAWNGVEEYLNS